MGFKDREKAKSYQKEYWLKNKQIKKEKNIQYWLRCKYDLSVEEYNELLTQQNFSCALCNKHVSECHRRLCVDHCHKTGKIRGLLCMNCNSALGKLGDTQESITRVLEYMSV